jgi:hypothetical protein
VVFDADPTADITNARQVRLVIHHGVVRPPGRAAASLGGSYQVNTRQADGCP